MYTIYQNNVKNSSTNGKFYARAKQIGMVGTDDIAQIIQRNCTVKKSDVKAVIEELVEVIQDKLQESYAVKLDGLGIFRLTIKSSPADTVKDFSASKNIKMVRCRFTPQRSRDTDGTVTRAFCTGTRLREYGGRTAGDTETAEP